MFQPINCVITAHVFKTYLTKKLNLSLYTLYYAEACNEFARPIFASLRPSNTASLEEMSQRWRAVGNTVSNSTGPGFEPKTSSASDKRITARPTARLKLRLIQNKTLQNIRCTKSKIGKRNQTSKGNNLGEFATPYQFFICLIFLILLILFHLCFRFNFDLNKKMRLQ